MLFPEMSFYKCGLWNHFNLNFSGIIAFSGMCVGEVPAAAAAEQLWLSLWNPSLQVKALSLFLCGDFSKI